MKSFAELPDHHELRRLWKQEPLDQPKPDLELTQDSWVERGAEVLGWSLARFEYWLSQSGWLRAWLRMNLLVSIILTSAGVLLLPPAERVLQQLSQSSHWVAAMVHDLFGILTSLPPVVISVGVIYLAFLVVRWFTGRRSSRRRDDYYQ